MFIGAGMNKMIKIFTLMFLSVVVQNVIAADVPPVVNDDQPMRGVRETHNAIETNALRISLDETMNGFIEGKVCDFCEQITVTITPETKAYANNVEVPLEQATGRMGRFATVIYELDTKNVSAIRW
jgi:hypothetical protein